MEKKAKDFYRKDVLKEWRRLTKDPFHRLEFETTLHFLYRYLPRIGLILDAGGGPGRYTIELAKRGNEIILFDLTPELLSFAEQRIIRAGVKDRVKLVVEGSITDLSQFNDDCFDGVICLGGALGHVYEKDNRKKAVSELFRVVKRGAPICISVIGRLAVIAKILRCWPEEVEMTGPFKEIWGKGDDDMWSGSSFHHFFLPEELEELFADKEIEILERVGLEGLSSLFPKEINKMARHSPKRWRNWLECHYALCVHPAVFATSLHIMIIGRKR